MKKNISLKTINKLKGINLSFWGLMIGITLTISGCQTDYYDADQDKGSGNSLFGDSVIIPSDFDWTTTQTINLNVSVDDQYNGQYYYVVEMYNANPVIDKNAALLGKGVAKLNKPFSTAISIPKALTTLYIQQINPTKGKTVAAIEVSSTNLSYTFTTVQAEQKSAMKSVGASRQTYSLRAASQYTSVPADAEKIIPTNGSINLGLAGKKWVLDSNFSGSINFWGQGEIYITGSLSTSDLRIPNNTKLIILAGGSSTFNGSLTIPSNAELYNDGAMQVKTGLKIEDNVKVTNDSKGVMNIGNDLGISTNSEFYNNGTTVISGTLKTTNGSAKIFNNNSITAANLTITGNNSYLENKGELALSGKIEVTNQGTITNGNTLEALSLTLDNGTFENNGEAKIKGTTSATNNTVNVINNGSFETKDLNVQGNATITNACLMTVNNTTSITDSKIINGVQSLLTTANISMNNTRIELGSEAMMEVTNQATYNYNPGDNYGFYGTGANKALLRIKKAVAIKDSQENIINYSGNLEIECADHISITKSDNRARWTMKGNATWANGTSTVPIPLTKCNNIGNKTNSGGGTTPSDPNFPINTEGTSWTYMFEDEWPSLGDYDMNDVVLDVTPSYAINTSNNVIKLTLDVTLKAVGATQKLAVGLQLDGVESENVRSVTRSNNTGLDNSVFSTSNGLESGQEWAVIPFFDEAHFALGNSGSVITNTIEGSGDNRSPLNVTIYIEFNNAVPMSSIVSDKLNLFIINGGTTGQRQEIHRAGFNPTGKADTRRFGGADDNSNSGKKYTSKDNYIWGLAVPTSVSYPKEKISISSAYPQMKDWATNGSNQEWYKSASSDKIYR